MEDQLVLDFEFLVSTFFFSIFTVTIYFYYFSKINNSNQQQKQQLNIKTVCDDNNNNNNNNINVNNTNNNNCNNEIINYINQDEGKEEYTTCLTIVDKQKQQLQIKMNQVFKSFKIFSGSILVVDENLNILSSSESVRDIFSNINDINGVNQKLIGGTLLYNFLNLVYQQDKEKVLHYLKSKFVQMVYQQQPEPKQDADGVDIDGTDLHLVDTILFQAIYHIGNSDLSEPFNLQVSILPFISENYIVLSLKDLSPPQQQPTPQQPLRIILTKSSSCTATMISPRSSAAAGNNGTSSPRSSNSNGSAISPRQSNNGGAMSPRSSTSGLSSSTSGTMSPRSSNNSNGNSSGVISPRSSSMGISFESLLNNKSIDMISHLSHELRTPIHSVIASIQLFRSTILTVTQNEYLSIIDTSANTLLELVSNVLDYKRIRSGKLTLNNVDFNLCHVIEDVCAMVSPQTQAKSLQIASFIFIHCPLSFYGDPIRLRQVLLNLIGNGLKYTNKGQVCISVEPEQVNEHCMYLHFQVKDSGIGIKEENMSKLFNGFSQVNNGGTTQEALGSGLGLAISKDLVELMGGKIWCTSNSTVNPGEAGCTFHFVIPLETNPKQLPCPIQNFNGLSVLVVDKNPYIQTVLCQYLEGWNCQVIKSSDIKEASSKLKDLRRQQIEVVMIDIDAIDFRDFIQFKEAFNRLEFGRIGLITMSSDRSMVNEMGFGTSKLTKPFRQSHLVACLLASMPEHSLSSTTCFPQNVVGINNQNYQHNGNSVYGNGNYFNGSNGNNNLNGSTSPNGTLMGQNRRLSFSLGKIPTSSNGGNNGIHIYKQQQDTTSNSTSVNGNGNSINSNGSSGGSPSSPRFKKFVELEKETNVTSPPLSSVVRNRSNSNSGSGSSTLKFDDLNSSSSSISGGSDNGAPSLSLSNSGLYNQSSANTSPQQSSPSPPPPQQLSYGRVTRRHSIDIIMFENSKELSELKFGNNGSNSGMEERIISPRGGPATIKEVDSSSSSSGASSNSCSLAQSPNSLSPRLGSITPPPVRPPTKIMLLDDSPVSLKLMQRILESRGFDCYPFDCSEKAIVAMESVNPAIIFMDCEMPRKNGFETTRLIRKNELESNTLLKDRKIIIALTAHINPEIQVKCFDAGMNDFISKPFKPASLELILRKWEDCIQSNHLNYKNSLLLSSSSTSTTTTTSTTSTNENNDLTTTTSTSTTNTNNIIISSN